MVYLNLPSKLTEQEQELKRKFAQLKKIKKQLAQLKTSTSRPAETENEKKNLKRTSEAAEAATEQAKKLLKSGAIKVDACNKSKQFKRARIDRGVMSKDNVERQGSITGYKPYNVSDTAPSSSFDDSEGSGRQARPSLRDTFVPSSYRDSSHSQPRRGPRVYVRGHGITEEMLRETFSTVGGTIVHINMEANKPSGFITFDTVETADEAVGQFNGTVVNGSRLDVEIARRQRGSHQSRVIYDKNNPNVPEPPASKKVDRKMVAYGEDDLFS